MKSKCTSLLIATLSAGLLPGAASAQTALTWQQVKDRFEASNPMLRSAQINIDESRAAETTAYLRPNPDIGLSVDGFQLNPAASYRPFSGVVQTPSFSYLHEREKKRELRLANAKNPRKSRRRPISIRSAACFSTCAPHLQTCCRPRHSSKTPSSI